MPTFRRCSSGRCGTAGLRRIPMTTAELQALRTLLAAAELPAGPLTWEQCYGMGKGKQHWALCDPASTADGKVSDVYWVLLASWPTWAQDAPETWHQPVST